MVKTVSGVDGYITKPDGTNNKKVFSLPLSQVLISWPSQNLLLAQTKSMESVPGIAFSIDAKSGTVTALLYANGITAKADAAFSHIIYQTDASGALTTYSHDVKKNNDVRLLFDPAPEQCIWSAIATSTMYCANPVSYVEPGYLDLWHLGAAAAADGIFRYNVISGSHSSVALPQQVNVLEMSLSPNEKYLSFTTKGARSLWAVRLTQ